MKNALKTLILAILLILPVLLSLNTQAAAIQSNVAIFNVTITASGGGNITTNQTNLYVIVGEPVIGNTTTNQTQFKFGFFHAQKTITGFLVTSNSPPNLPIWIFPTNGTVIQDDNIIVLQYSSSDPEGDPITYYLYQNGEFTTTAPRNHTVELLNGSYNYSVSAFDGNLYSANATTFFEVDVPLSSAWAIPVAMIYIASVAMFILYAFTIKDKQFINSGRASSLIPQEIVDIFVNLLKLLFFTLPFAMVLLGLHLAIIAAESGGAPSAAISTLVLAFQIWMWLTVLVMFTYFVIVFRESLIMIADIAKVSGFEKLKKRRMAKRGQK